MNTIDLLLRKYGATLTTKELGEVLKMTPASIRNAISAEVFPIPTWRQGRQRLADIRDVAQHLDDQRAASGF